MNLFCNFQPESPTNFVYHHERGPRKDEVVKSHPDPYEVNRKKPGYTHITGPTLILGDESSSGMRTGLKALGAGRCMMSGKKEVAATGQTTERFLEKIKKTVGFTMKIYSNAIINVGKHDILKTNDSAQDIYGRMQKIWNMLDKHNMKIHACTIPPIKGETTEQKKRREELNKLIRETDEPLFNVIDLEKALKKVDTTSDDLYIDGKLRREIPKTDKDKLAVAYLKALSAGGRDGFKEVADRHFAGPPTKVAYTMVGDSFAKPVERSLGGTKKSPGHYVSSIEPEKPLDPIKLPAPGKNTEKMAKELETKVIPALTKKPGYRCAVIQAGAEDIMAPLESDADMQDAEKAITKNLKRMYRRCLESNPPVMVVAVTLTPMSKHIDEAYPGEENREERERHYKLYRKVNAFIIKETFRLSQHPKDRYKRVMCVRAHDMMGTRKGYLRKKYMNEAGALNNRGKRQMAMQIHKAINGMQVGIDFGKRLYSKPKLGPNGKPMKDAKGKPVFESLWSGPDYFLDEHDYKPQKKTGVPKKAPRTAVKAKEKVKTFKGFTETQRKKLRQNKVVSLRTRTSPKGKLTAIRFKPGIDVTLFRGNKSIRVDTKKLIELTHWDTKSVKVESYIMHPKHIGGHPIRVVRIIVNNTDGSQDIISASWEI